MPHGNLQCANCQVMNIIINSIRPIITSDIGYRLQSELSRMKRQLHSYIRFRSA